MLSSLNGTGYVTYCRSRRAGQAVYIPIMTAKMRFVFRVIVSDQHNTGHSTEASPVAALADYG